MQPADLAVQTVIYSLKAIHQILVYIFDFLSLTEEVCNLPLCFLQSVLKGLICHRLIPSPEVCYEALQLLEFHSMLSNLILHQPVTSRTLLAARPRPIVEIVLFTLVTAIAHEAFPAFATAVILTLERKGSFVVTVARFAAFRSKPKVVGLTALTVLTGDAGLTLTLPGADVTLPVGGAQSMAVTPLAALPTLQVVEARVTSATVPA